MARTPSPERLVTMVGLLITILIAILAYWLIVPIAGLPTIVGIVAAILILIGGLRTHDWR
jgi:hypothetical protein